jgi:hypothetical protein
METSPKNAHDPYLYIIPLTQAQKMALITTTIYRAKSPEVESAPSCLYHEREKNYRISYLAVVTLD